MDTEDTLPIVRYELAYSFGPLTIREPAKSMGTGKRRFNYILNTTDDIDLFNEATMTGYDADDTPQAISHFYGSWCGWGKNVYP